MEIVLLFTFTLMLQKFTCQWLLSVQINRDQRNGLAKARTVWQCMEV
jgi:hypothetical protein